MPESAVIALGVTGAAAVVLTIVINTLISLAISYSPTGPIAPRPGAERECLS